MIRKVAAGLAVVLLTASPALARHCPQDMAEIDRALAADPAVSPEVLVQVKELRERGEELHNAGNHAESEAVLAEAKVLLQLD